MMSIICTVYNCTHNNDDGTCAVDPDVTLQGDDNYHWLFNCSDMDLNGENEVN